MAKHDYKKLLLEVECWESSRMDALDAWEKDQWEAYDKNPEGRYFDTIGDGAGFRFTQIQSSVGAFVARIQEAEEYGRNGDDEMAVQILTEVCKDLGIASDTWEHTQSGQGSIDSTPKQASILKWIMRGVLLVLLIGTITFCVLPML